VDKDWSPCFHTLEGHGDSVCSIAWSQDGSRLVSASWDNTVRIWDPATGQCASILEGHSNIVNAIAWSQDGSRLASASDDKTVRIWDPATGQCASTLHISSPDFVQFDKVNLDHLHTSIGTFDIGFTGTVTSTHCSTLPEQYGYGLNDDHSWITYNGVNLLWLPAEYRPTESSLFAMSSTNLAIACSSCRIIFLALTEQSPIPCLF
jgi:WD40 repeat protein